MSFRPDDKTDSDNIIIVQNNQLDHQGLATIIKTDGLSYNGGKESLNQQINLSKPPSNLFKDNSFKLDASKLGQTSTKFNKKYPKTLVLKENMIKFKKIMANSLQLDDDILS